MIWLVLTLFVLLGYSLQSAAGSAYYSMVTQNYATVSTPPVILQNGTAGTSTIYANNTSAKVGVEAPLFDYVDNNDPDLDSSADKGMHSNFPAEQAGPDSTYDTLKEENTEAIEDYVDQQSDIDSSSDLGSHDIFNNLKAIDSTYDNMTEVEVGGEDAWEWSETVPGGYAPTSSYTNYIFASDFTPSSSYTATRIGIYAFADPQNNPDVKLAIYNQSAGEPDQVLGETAIFQITGSGWFDVDLTTPVELSSGVTYSVAHITEDTPTTQWRYNEIATPVSDYYLLSSWPDFDEGVDWTQSASYRYGAYRVGYTTGGDYQLDLEVQFTDVMDFLPTEKLCIHAGPLGDEDLRVDYWNGTGWENLATDLNPYSCNEYTVSLTSTIFTIRFKGGNETGDTTQDQWQIDATLLRVEGAGSKEDAVDQQSNVDGSADVGTHSNFTAQQYGPDSINDTLTEQNIGIFSNSTLLDDGFEAVDWDANWDNIPHNWLEDNFPVHSGSASAWATDGNEGYFTCDDLNASGGVAIYVDFWYRLDDTETDDLILYYYDGSVYDEIAQIGGGTEDTWLHYTEKITDSQYFIFNFRIRFYASPDTFAGENMWVDDVLIKKEFQSADNYELDLEVQWTNLPYLLPNETLCIYGGTMGVEDIKVDVWNETGWETVFTDLSSGWNNASITGWLTTSNFTIRFKGGNETADVSQDTWQIDVALIHVWHDGGESYELDLEVQWTSADYTRANEELCIKTGTFIGSENIQVRVWNSTGSSWHWVMNLTANQWNNVSITSYLTSSTFTVQYLGGTETGDTSEDSWNIDATLLHVWTSQDTLDYVDTNTTDVDSSADKGTHGNFTAQEYLDDIYDTLTEADTSTPITSDNNVDSETITHGSTTGISGAQTTDGTTENMTEGTIEKIGTDTSGTGSALNLSFSHTLVSGTNRIVIVTIGIENGNTTDVDSVTYGGQTCTKAIDHTAISTGFRFLVEIWYILDADLPSDGSQTVVVTCSGIIYELEVNAFCSEYAGVTQGAPEATDGYNQTIGSTITNTISPSDNAWVISGVGAGNIGDWAHGEGQVEVLEFDDNSSTFAVAELRGASGETSLSSNYTGTINRLCRACASWTEAATYQLDIEHVVDSIGEYENYNLTTRAYRTASENFYLQLYNFTSSQWVNMSTITASSLTWYNTSFAKADFVNSTNQVRIRYWQGVDATQETLYVDYSGVYGWNATTNHELDLEVQWTGADYTRANEELCIKTGTFIGSENIQVRVWNSTGSSWHWVMNLTANQWNNVSITSYLTSSTFTVQYLGGTETGDTSEDSWNIDVSLLHVSTAGTTYDYVLRVNNTVTDSWQVRLKRYADSNVNRLQDCTIYFHNSTDGTSNQIIIENGSYVNQTGPWYDLGDSETIYIAMTVKANDAATSYVYAYLEIRTPNTTTYAQYVITFEIT